MSQILSNWRAERISWETDAVRIKRKLGEQRRSEYLFAVQSKINDQPSTALHTPRLGDSVGCGVDAPASNVQEALLAVNAPLSPCVPSQSQEPLDKQAASRLAGAFSTMQLRQGETVAAEGDTVDRCYLIEYGSIEVRTAHRGTLCVCSVSCSAKHGRHVRLTKDVATLLQTRNSPCNSSLRAKMTRVLGVRSEVLAVRAGGPTVVNRNVRCKSCLGNWQLCRYPR